HLVPHDLEEHRQAVGAVAVVVHDQNAALRQRRQRFFPTRRRRFGPRHSYFDWEAADELASAAWPGAISLDAPRVWPGQASCQRKADAQTALGAPQGRRRLREDVEDAWHRLRANTDTAIPDRHDHFVPLPTGS